MNKVFVKKTKDRWSDEIILVTIGEKQFQYDNVPYECDSASCIANLLNNLVDAGMITLEYADCETIEWINKHKER